MRFYHDEKSSCRKDLSCRRVGCAYRLFCVYRKDNPRKSGRSRHRLNVPLRPQTVFNEDSHVVLQRDFNHLAAEEGKNCRRFIKIRERNAALRRRRYFLSCMLENHRRYFTQLRWSFLCQICRRKERAAPSIQSFNFSPLLPAPAPKRCRKIFR